VQSSAVLIRWAERGGKAVFLEWFAAVFNNLLSRLAASFEQQRRFMADASHELRTPLSIVSGEAEVALSQVSRSTEDLRESLYIVHDEGRRLTRIVEDLFTLARADAGQYKLASQDFYLDEIIAEAAHSVRTLVAERGLTLQCDATIEMPFRGDENLLRRLILNLLDNAIKHSTSGGKVIVLCERRRSEYQVSISDTGRGIPPEAQPHIFERFFRADRARTRTTSDRLHDNGNNGQVSGAGLGLAIAQWIAEAHKGTLVLLHSDSSGTVFQFKLPVAASPDV